MLLSKIKVNCCCDKLIFTPTSLFTETMSRNEGNICIELQQSRDLQSSSTPSNKTEVDKKYSPIYKCLKIALLSLVAVIGVLVLLLPSIVYYWPMPSVSFPYLANKC